MGCLPAARELGGGFAAGGGRGAGIRLWVVETGVARFVGTEGTGGAAGAETGTEAGANGAAAGFPTSAIFPAFFFFFFLFFFRAGESSYTSSASCRSSAASRSS